MAACLWIPGYPPDKADPAPDPTDPPGSSHCNPHAGGLWSQDPSRPVLLDSAIDERRFQCRINRPDQVTWTVRPVGLAGRNSYVIADGVARLDLHIDALPWSPLPYRAELELQVRAGGNQQITTWPLVVLPHGDDFFLPLGTADEGESNPGQNGSGTGQESEQ